MNFWCYFFKNTNLIFEKMISYSENRLKSNSQINLDRCIFDRTTVIQIFPKAYIYIWQWTSLAHKGESCFGPLNQIWAHQSTFHILFKHLRAGAAGDDLICQIQLILIQLVCPTLGRKIGDDWIILYSVHKKEEKKNNQRGGNFWKI